MIIKINFHWKSLETEYPKQKELFITDDLYFITDDNKLLYGYYHLQNEKFYSYNTYAKKVIYNWKEIKMWCYANSITIQIENGKLNENSADYKAKI